MSRIFIVEDNANIAEALASYLRLEDLTPVLFPRLAGVLEAMRMDVPALVILDVMLPDGDGFNFARQVKREFAVPILFLTARVAESDRITGLELGADDYVVKPFSNRELVLRVKAILRRGSQAASAGPVANPERPVWILGANDRLILDLKAHRVWCNDRELELTAAEWKILLGLAEHAGMVLSRDQLLASALDYIADGSERTIDTHVKNIRSKLGRADWIETVRGFGYRFSGSTES